MASCALRQAVIFSGQGASPLQRNALQAMEHQAGPNAQAEHEWLYVLGSGTGRIQQGYEPECGVLSSLQTSEVGAESKVDDALLIIGNETIHYPRGMLPIPEFDAQHDLEVPWPFDSQLSQSSIDNRVLQGSDIHSTFHNAPSCVIPVAKGGRA